MKASRLRTVLIATILLMPLFISCVPLEHQSKEYKKIAQEWLQVSDMGKIGEALAQRIKDGATLQDFLPPTGVMIMGLAIPIVAIIGAALAIILFLVMYHRRVMAMIEKGIYVDKPFGIRWDLIMLLGGLILVFVGPAVSIYLVSYYGLFGWSVSGGVIPLFTGIALLVFYKIGIKK